MYNLKNTAVSPQSSAVRKNKHNGSGPIGTNIGISGSNPLQTNETLLGGGGAPHLSGYQPPATDHQPPASPDARRSREHLTLANRAPRCVHVKPNGLRCGSPAIKGTLWCHFHDRWLNGSEENTFPPLEDGNGVQVALMYVLERLRREAFAGGQVNVPVAKALLYGLQTASWNLRFTNFSPTVESPITCDATLVRPDEHVPIVGPKRPSASAK